jgi:glycogen debranching enzyme
VTEENGGRRTTPKEPHPERRQPVEGSELPPQLGTDAIAVLEGRTFMFSDARGDVPPGSVGGLLHDDTRFVSCWRLTLNGEPLSVLRSRAVDHYSAAFFLTNPDLPGLPASTLSVRRLRFVGNGLREQIIVHNPGPRSVALDLRLEVGADFADLFEVKGRVRDRSGEIRISHAADPPRIRFRYARGAFAAGTSIEVHASRVAGDVLPADVLEVVGRRPVSPGLGQGEISWAVELPHRSALAIELRVAVERDERTLEPIHVGFGEEREEPEGALTRWLAEVPRFRSDDRTVEQVFERSVLDLAALRIAGELGGESYVLPAAGLPWFMTLFGRDTIVTGLQTLWVGPELARGGLHLLGALQGTEVDDFRDEEPGKILHEIRSGELTVLGEEPYSPYYGTVDATPLWLVLMSEYWRFTDDGGFVRQRWDRVRAALDWIDRYGDLDGDGYVEYRTRSPRGLGNQGWKDSWDGIQHADGRIPVLPIALAEVQGYVYDAKLRVAELAERLMGDEALATRLRGEARALADRFDRDFWSEERGGYYVVGLDGDKRPIDSMTSNMGHLLWSGIVPEDRAPRVVRQLMSPDLFSGWGIRTLSRRDAGFNPIGYHTGTVWPHDNALIALGLARYGFREEANRVALCLLEASSFTEFRLPEVFAGFDRSVARFPVPYPTASSPQAWATGAPFVFIRTMLGMDAHDREVTIDPRVPERIGRIRIHGMHAFGTHWDVEASGTNGHVRLTH